LPTGTAQLIVDLSGDGLSVPNLPDRAMLHGADTLAHALETDRPLFQLGVDFKPGGAYPFFAPPASVLQNAHLSLDALWDRQPVADLRDHLAGARTQEECARLLEHTLLRQLVRPLRHHPAVVLALRVLSGPPPEDADALVAESAQIGRVAEAAGLSAGYFTHLFQEEVGLTPKQFVRVQRFRSILRRAYMEQPEQPEQPEQRVHWAHLAADCGYYDQAHLIKDFQAFAGVSPSVLLRARSVHCPSSLLLPD
jgi:AraC-like DNA-binding protein